MITKSAEEFLEKEAGFKDLAAIFKRSPMSKNTNYLSEALRAKAAGKHDLAKSLYAKHHAASATGKHNWGINKQVPTGGRLGDFDKTINQVGGLSAGLTRSFA